MKIALFASAFYPSLGGVEELVRQLAHALQRRGHEAIVLTQRWPRDLPTFEEYEGIPLYRIAFRSPAASPKARLSFALTHRAVQRQADAILRRHATDLIHVQCVSSNAFYALGSHQNLRLPLVVTTQGERTMDATGVYERSRSLNTVMRRALASADAITACSLDTLRDVERFSGAEFGNRGQVVYNGIRSADFANAAEFSHPRPYILGIGRFVPQKGFDLLIEAFSKAKIPAFNLILAGDGAERAALEKQAQQSEAASRIHFVGRAPREKAAALFGSCAFFVLPSRMEPQGIVNLEAMAAGKAVVAARVGGVPEIVLNGETGLLFEGGNAAQLAQHLELLGHNPDLRERLGQAGRARAAQFDWDAIAAQYLAIYEGVLGSKTGARALVAA